jgi:hypothetical protein
MACFVCKQRREMFAFLGILSSSTNPFIPLLWSKEESKEIEKQNCLVFTFCKSLDCRGFTLHNNLFKGKRGVFGPLLHSPNP